MKKIVTTIREFNELNNNFKRWFKNSKIVDKSKKPLVLYHGSPNNFDTFKVGKKTRQSYYCDGFYFSYNLEKVYDYGDNIFKCYLSIQNPFIINDKTLKLADKYAETDNADEFKNEVEQYCKYTIGYRSENSKFKDNIIKDGYDGLIIEKFGIYIAFYPNQIKSIKNDGSWNTDDDNIYS